MATCGWWLLGEQQQGSKRDDKETFWRTTSRPVPGVNYDVPTPPPFCIFILPLPFKKGKNLEGWVHPPPQIAPSSSHFPHIFPLHPKSSQEEPRDFSAGNKIEQIGNLLPRSSKQTCPQEHVQRDKQNTKMAFPLFAAMQNKNTHSIKELMYFFRLRNYWKFSHMWSSCCG